MLEEGFACKSVTECEKLRGNIKGIDNIDLELFQVKESVDYIEILENHKDKTNE